jgi:transcriptional regulator with XRE-family HTH domain
MTLGAKLKRFRLKKNYTQEYLADTLHISQKTYSNFENNKTTPDFSQMEEISKILEVSVLEFLSDNGVSFNYDNIHGGNNGFIYQNQIPEKLIQQYELRISELKEIIEFLKK